MHESQKVEQVWDTPPLDEIPTISKMHVGAMEATDDDAVWVQAGMHHVVLKTKGHVTGREHKVALPFWRDPDGHRIVVASFAGAAKDPAWFTNLRADPTVVVRTPHGSFTTTAEVVDGEERDRIWALLVADRAWYETYQAKTSRPIPLVRLREPESGAKT